MKIKCKYICNFSQPAEVPVLQKKRLSPEEETALLNYCFYCS